MYGMSYKPDSPESQTNRLVDALNAAAKRGVKVRVLLDRSDYNEIINTVNERTKEHLESGGVEVRWDDEHVTSHAKLICADGAVVIGSYNWGYDALERRNECAVIIRDKATTEFFLSYFETLWEGKPWKSGVAPAPSPKPAEEPTASVQKEPQMQPRS
jgi:phosphatidylserine/phosphatidylglycerophosphate/cardiolipin synthase-like enzyme